MKSFFGRMSRRRKIILGAAAAVVLIVVWVMISRGRSNSSSAYQTTPLKRGELTATVGATGTVRALQSATLSWQIDGVISAVNVRVGDHVNKGDVLAELDKSQLPESVILAQADLVSAQKALQDATSNTGSAQSAIDLKDAQDAYKKAYNYRLSLNGKQWIEEVRISFVGGQQVPMIVWHRGYVDSGTIQKADNDLALKKAQLDDAQRNYDRLKEGPNPADIAAAQAKVDAAQATLNEARIIAPISGTVTQAISLPGDVVSGSLGLGSTSSSGALGQAATAQAAPAQTTGTAAASSGQTAAQGQTAFRIDDLSSLLVDVQVSEVDINSVALNQPATLTLDAVQNQTYQGQVVKVSQAGDLSSGAVNFTVSVQLIDADKQVKPGMTAAVNIIVKQVKDQLLVPNRAVRIVNDQQVVYVLKNGQPQPVKITLGVSSDTESVIAGGDLKEGDLLILNPPSPEGGPFRGGGGG